MKNRFYIRENQKKWEYAGADQNVSFHLWKEENQYLFADAAVRTEILQVSPISH